MPYPGERAARLGHVPTVNNAAIQAALQGWQVTHGTATDPMTLTAACLSLADIPGQEGNADDVKYSLTVDGSDSEVEATREHPTVKVGYLRIAGSMVNLTEFRKLDTEKIIDPRRVRRAHNEYAFDAALPGSGLVRPGMTGRDTWRYELNQFLLTSRIDGGTSLTLADGLLAIRGAERTPATSVEIAVCPMCKYKPAPPQSPLSVSKTGGTCPDCAGDLYLADILRLHEEYNEEGSNFSPITRAMNMAERLMTTCYIEFFMGVIPEALKHTIFITDGPLALHGPVAPQSRTFLAHHQTVMETLAATGQIAGPLVVGVEKSGAFVEHAERIKDLIPTGSALMLTNDYINRITGRPDDNQYGTDEFYGRRFIYRTSTGDALVITVVPKPGVAPYSSESASEDHSSYPFLRVICETLDSLRTRMYHNAVIPVALAHSSASLPLGVGRSVLTKLAQEYIPGLAHSHQAVQAPTYFRGR